MTNAVADDDATASQAPTEPVVVGYPDHKGVRVERVTYPNIRFETVIAANLFLPANLDSDRKHAAILVGHPFLGVKEQTSGLHAQLLAEQGYIAMAFDASHYGDSTGEPRFMESPAIRVEDFHAGVDFLSNHPLVDPERIGVLGICGGGGYSVNAAQMDHRIRAIATVSMFDLGRVRREGLDGEITQEARMKILDAVAQERTKESSGQPARFFDMQTDQFGSGAPLGEKTAALGADLMDYYATPRGAHPNCTGVFTFTSLPGMFGFFPFTQIETISPRPLLMIVGEKAPSAYFSEDAYSKAAEPKELFVIPGASHADLYDKAPYITQSLEKLVGFFNDNLK
ncbi:alpha/beta hydrolase [Streptomyces mirabilis]|uniref:alpha/beta hydrolase n=1 Tax=Streptomyces mirabilis TaxID=68239 RepID=UPI00331670F3